MKYSTGVRSTNLNAVLSHPLLKASDNPNAETGVNKKRYNQLFKWDLIDRRLEGKGKLRPSLRWQIPWISSCLAVDLRESRFQPLQPVKSRVSVPVDVYHHSVSRQIRIKQKQTGRISRIWQSTINNQCDVCYFV